MVAREHAPLSGLLAGNPAMHWVRSRRGRRRILAPGVIAVMIAALLWALLGATGFPVSKLALGGGKAWLASSRVSLLSLIDGSTEERVALVDVSHADSSGDFLDVQPFDTDAFVVDGRSGVVVHVDGANFVASPPVRFGETGEGVALAAYGPNAFVVNGGRGEVTQIDPKSMGKLWSTTVARRSPSLDAVVDRSGTLWIAGGGVAGVSQLSAHGRESTLRSVGGPGSRLVIVQGSPVLLDSRGSKVGALDAGQLGPGWSTCLGWSETDMGSARVMGSSQGAWLYAVSSVTGNLTTVGVGSSGRCGPPVPVGEPGDTFGPLVEAHGFVLVPNQTTGRAYVVEVASGHVIPLDAGRPKQGLELIAQDGIVYYNELASERAGVIRFDGRGWHVGGAIRKYNPDKPSDGVQTPPTQTPSLGAPSTPSTSATSPETSATTPSKSPTATRTPDGPGNTTSLPVVEDITWVPDPPRRGRQVTFTARVSGGQASAWAWTLTSEDGTRRSGSSPGSFAVVLPEKEGTESIISLSLRNARGASKPYSEHFDHFFQSHFDVLVSGGGRVVVTIDGSAGPTCLSTSPCTDLPLADARGEHKYSLRAFPQPGWVLSEWGQAHCLEPDGITPLLTCAVSETSKCRCAWTFNVQFIRAPMLRLTVQLANPLVHVTGVGIDCPGDCSETRAAVRWNVTLTASARSTWNGCGPDAAGTTCTLTLTATDPAAVINVTPETSTLAVSYVGSDRGTQIASGDGRIRCGNVAVGPQICSAEYLRGSTVTLRRAGVIGGLNIVFDGGGCAASLNTCTVSIDNQDVSVQATVKDPVIKNPP